MVVRIKLNDFPARCWRSRSPLVEESLKWPWNREPRRRARPPRQARRGPKVHKQAGLIAVRQSAVLDALEIRFGEVPDSIRQSIKALQDEDRLRSLHRRAIQASSLEALAGELAG